MPSGEQRKFGKGGAVKGPTILPASHSLRNLACVTTGWSRALLRLADSDENRSPTKWIRKPKRKPSSHNHAAKNQADPLLLAWLACCGEADVLSRLPFQLKGNPLFGAEAEHWPPGCFPPHLKHTCSNLHPEQCLPAWKAQQVPFGKNWERKRGLLVGGCGLRKVFDARNHNSQCILSHGYCSGADCLM